jgi:hypothetical protein
VTNYVLSSCLDDGFEYLSAFLYFSKFAFVGMVFYPTHSYYSSKHHILKLLRINCSVLINIQVWYSSTLHTYIFMKLFFISILMLLEHKNVHLFINADFACEILNLIPMIHFLSWLIELPRY